MNLTTDAISFDQVEDQLVSLWLNACRLQFLAQDLDTCEAWESAARAWASLARETPLNARADLVVYWNLAADDAAKAKKVPPTSAASQGGPGDARRRRGLWQAISNVLRPGRKKRP